MTDATVDAPDRARRPPWLLIAFGLLAVVVILELAAGPLFRPGTSGDTEAQVLAIPGVSGMIRGAQIDPTELKGVAGARHRPAPSAFAAQALIDGLLLLEFLTIARPRLVAIRWVSRRGRLFSFLGSLAILLVGIVVVVGAIARLRYLAALYLSPPVGTLSYLLLYGSFRRSDVLVALTLVMILKAVVSLVLSRARLSTPAWRGVMGLALTSLAATVVTAICYSWASVSLGNLTDALAASIAAMAAVLWAGILVSGSVRRLT
jgi:hypothetical protein